MSEREQAQVKAAPTRNDPPAHTALLQRKCACGGAAGPDGECAACRRRRLLGQRNPSIQPRLRIDQPGDRYEQEADEVAEQIMRMPETGVPGGPPGPTQHRDTRLQRLCSTGRGLRRKEEESQRTSEAPDQFAEITPEIEAQIEALRGTGQPLSESARAFFEPRLGHDFGGVRVHTDARAASTSRALRAQAFTIERDIVFGAGQYAPETATGRQLLAHELTHVVQQGAASRVQRPAHRADARDHRAQPDAVSRPLAPGASSIRLIVPDGPEILIRPPSIDTSGAPSVGPATDEQAVAEQPAAEQTQPESEPVTAVEEDIGARIQRMPRYTSRPGLIQRTATFTNPAFQAQDPLTRLAAGQPPGLTTPTINGNLIPDLQQVLTEVSPTQVSQTGGAAGNVTCQFDRGFTIDTSANVIVASNAGAGGWVGNFPVARLGNPPVCAGQAQIPATMNALPNNAAFVTRVRASEQEHVDEIRTLHNRHFVPYDRFLMGLSGRGANLNACGQDLVNKLGNRHTQAAVAFTLGYQAATEKLDGPGGTHEDSAVPTFAANCASVNLRISQATPPVPGAGPGNVVTVAPRVTKFNPAKLSVVGTDIREGKTVIKSFSNAANANQALKVIKHYGMTSRNVIGAMEYFLVGNNAPSGALAGASEQAIDPAMYQVTLNVPNAGDWAITEVVGNNVTVLVNFGARRNEAYSAWSVMRGFAFTRICWVGSSLQSAEMTYFRV